MNALRLIPVLLSSLLLAAHFYRAGNAVMVALALAIIALLALRQRWVPPLVSVALLLGALEWLRTLVSLASLRMDLGLPWLRLALILGIVALVTAASPLVFRSRALRTRYRRSA